MRFLLVKGAKLSRNPWSCGGFNDFHIYLRTSLPIAKGLSWFSQWTTPGDCSPTSWRTTPLSLGPGGSPSYFRTRRQRVISRCWCKVKILESVLTFKVSRHDLHWGWCFWLTIAVIASNWCKTKRYIGTSSFVYVFGSSYWYYPMWYPHMPHIIDAIHKLYID